MRVALSILLLLLFIPGWMGEERLPLFGHHLRLAALHVALDPHDRARNRVGRLVWLGGISLASDDPAFGGFSSLSVTGDRFTLLSDSGNFIRFRLDDDWHPRALSAGNLPAGPGRGWDKRDRDSESMTLDAATGQVWVGFESHNQIWRYADGFARAEAHAAPPAMQEWPENLGAESLVRLPSGGFIVIGEHDPWPGGDGRAAIRFAGDPTVHPRAGFRFTYLPPAGYDPSDATLLPDGDLLVLNRRFAFPYDFTVKLTIVAGRAIHPGARVAGREIASLAAPLIHDNFEGVAITRERGATIVWLVSDDNQSMLQRTLLLKFRLAG